MLAQWSRNWWLVLLRGVISVLFGMTALILPLATIQVLVLFIGVFALVDGTFAVVSAISSRAGHNNWWVLLIEGLLGIITGVLVALQPRLAVLALLFLISSWAIVTGVLEIAAAVQLRKEIEGEWMLALGGVASILFGVVLAIFPTAGAVTIAWIIGWYAILFGGMLIGLGWRLHNHGQSRPTIHVMP